MWLNFPSLMSPARAETTLSTLCLPSILAGWKRSGFLVPRRLARASSTERRKFSGLRHRSQFLGVRRMQGWDHLRCIEVTLPRDISALYGGHLWIGG